MVDQVADILARQLASLLGWRQGIRNGPVAQSELEDVIQCEVLIMRNLDVAGDLREDGL